MAPTQTSYPSEMAAAFAGMIANTEPNVLISREVAGAAIGFGKAVKQGTAANQVEAATAAADVYRGITVRENSEADDTFAVRDSARLMTKGVVWVVAGATVAAGAPVYMVVGTGQAGNFTSVATNNLPIPGAVFDSGGAAGALVKIRLG